MYTVTASSETGLNAALDYAHPVLLFHFDSEDQNLNR